MNIFEGILSLFNLGISLEKYWLSAELHNSCTLRTKTIPGTALSVYNLQRLYICDSGAGEQEILVLSTSSTYCQETCLEDVQTRRSSTQCVKK